MRGSNLKGFIRQLKVVRVLALKKSRRSLHSLKKKIDLAKKEFANLINQRDVASTDLLNIQNQIKLTHEILDHPDLSEIKLVAIPEGDIVLTPGSSPSLRGTKIHVKKFLLSQYEVTQVLWNLYMGSTQTSTSYDCERCPAINISLGGALEFIRRINEQNKKSYRLPTDIEWEYACRAGKDTMEKYCGGNDADKVAWYRDNTQRLQQIGGRAANAWGLHDMSGNASEWTCSKSRQHGNTLQSIPNHIGSTTPANECSIRGGSYADGENLIKYEYKDKSIWGNSNVGIRLAEDM
jgi:formylglycine-generating enzyme required for sulfatase activity